MKKHRWKVHTAKEQMCKEYNIETVTKCEEFNYMSLYKLQDELFSTPPKRKKLIRKTKAELDTGSKKKKFRNLIFFNK